MRTLAVVGGLLAGVALAVAPLALAQAPQPIRRIDMSRLRGDSGAANATGPTSFTRTLPDPTPMLEKAQLVYDLRWSKGEVFLLGVRRIELPTPQHTPRAMGRFALELFEGPTVIERVRFDFPLLGAGEVDAGRNGPPSFEKKLTTRIGITFPAAKRGTKLELWDRATDQRWPLPWPTESAPTERAQAPRP